MRYLILSCLTFAMLAVLAGNVAAQETEAAAQPLETSTQETEVVDQELEAAVQDEPAPAPTLEVERLPATSYDEMRRDELRESALRSRNALIGTSVAAVVGIPLVFAGARTQCVKTIDGSGQEQTSCTTGGKVMIGIGYPFMIGGITGALVTGIMLGVRKGKIRDLDRKLAYSKSRALRWDLATSQFVF